MNCGNVFGANIVKLNNSEDRFFKYKAAKGVSVRILVCEEMLSEESMVKLLKLMEEIYIKVFNIKFEYVEIPYDELTTNVSSIAQIQDTFGVVFPVELSDIAKDTFWYRTPAFFTSELILITGPPTEVGKYSMSFLTLDNTVSCLLLLCIVALPLLAGLSEFVTNSGQERRQRKTSIGRKVRNYLSFSWDFVGVFFYEPFLRVPKCLSWRITVGSWLIAILIISIFMGSALKTELYSTEHILIDNLESFSKYTQAKIIFSRSDSAAGYFKEWENSIMDSQPELSLASRVEYLGFFEALDIDLYRRFFLGMAGGLISELYLKNLLPVLLKADADSRNLVFYFNAELIRNQLFVFPFSRELKSCPELIEQIDLITYVTTETRVLDYFFMKNNFYISRVVWQKPLKTHSAMTINEAYGAFLIFAYGLAIAIATFVFEVIIKLVSTYH